MLCRVFEICENLLLRMDKRDSQHHVHVIYG